MNPLNLLQHLSGKAAFLLPSPSCLDFQKDKHSASSVVEELKVELAQKERELQTMKEEAEELHSLRQQNYLLQSKVHKHTQHKTFKS